MRSHHAFAMLIMSVYAATPQAYGVPAGQACCDSRDATPRAFSAAREGQSWLQDPHVRSRSLVVSRWLPYGRSRLIPLCRGNSARPLTITYKSSRSGRDLVTTTPEPSGKVRRRAMEELVKGPTVQYVEDDVVRSRPCRISMADCIGTRPTLF